MGFVFDERPANSSSVEEIWRTHSERAGSLLQEGIPATLKFLGSQSFSSGVVALV